MPVVREESKSSATSGRIADTALTGRVKDYALNVLKADLVGIANIERFTKAPAMMSPQGIMPSARSVIVMAVHHPDASIEMGGREHPQIIGPYAIQYHMNSVLDNISYRMGLFLERQGVAAIPIVSSNIWRYKGYKELTEQFAPDMSHLHAAVAAGLAEFGYNGLAITPEFGARQRYVSIITEAVLEPTPLLEPGSVCDNCNLCVKHCLSGALSKELNGFNVVEIEDKKYTYANKNLWRCAWGEHFDIDLDLPKPEKIDEKVILENALQHGRRGGEMGSCLRYCVPKARRYFDREYTNAPRRRRRQPDDSGLDRGLQQRITSIAFGHGADFASVITLADLDAWGIDAKPHLPDAAALVVVGLQCSPLSEESLRGEERIAREYLLHNAAYDIARELERGGYSSISISGISEETVRLKLEENAGGRHFETVSVLTAAPLQGTAGPLPHTELPGMSAPALGRYIKRFAIEQGLDLAGIAPAARLDDLHGQLSALFDGAKYFRAINKGRIFAEIDPEVSVEQVQVKRPEDHLPGARSVIVLGMRLLEKSVERTAQPPAESVGVYAFAQYISVRLLSLAAVRLMRELEKRGHKAVMTFDLSGTESFLSGPRGEQPDVFSNRFAAVAAGLGHIGRGGFLLTPEFGPNVRFVAIVTDADISPDEVSPDLTVTAACEGCTICTDTCRTGAHGELAQVTIGGSREKFLLRDRNRCDWAKRYSMVGEEGPDYTGWKLRLPVPEEITAANLAEAMKQHPPIEKMRVCNFEACAIRCPLAQRR